MITYEKAVEIINANRILLEAEKVELTKCLNRVIREDVVSDMDMPPFNKSAMDGYACRREDLLNELEVIETVAAGYTPLKIVGANQCSKIMTGAMLPQGADCVIIVEEVIEVGENKIRFVKDKTANNICTKGEDVVVGQKLLSSGTRISSKEIAALAMAGVATPLVSVKPKIGIITTGDEIVEPGVTLKESQIRNTNAYQIIMQAKEFGCHVNYYGIVKDNEEEISKAVAQGKNENDLILLTGGVSMGEFDLVPGILKKNGFELLFEKVAVQPGKPTVFGRDQNKFVFGMPGNPVSSYIVFEFFVKEFVAQLLGLAKYKKEIKLELAMDFTRKRNERLARIPIKINEEGKVELIDYHGSAHINSLSFADGIISIPIGVSQLKKGTVVDVRPI